MYTEYVFENKKYEVALRDLKATMFDIVSKEESNISKLKAKADGVDGEHQKELEELFVRQEACLKSLLDLTAQIESTLQKVDSCSRDLIQIEDKNVAEIIARVQDTNGEEVINLKKDDNLTSYGDHVESFYPEEKRDVDSEFYEVHTGVDSDFVPNDEAEFTEEQPQEAVGDPEPVIVQEDTPEATEEPVMEESSEITPETVATEEAVMEYQDDLSTVDAAPAEGEAAPAEEAKVEEPVIVEEEPVEEVPATEAPQEEVADATATIVGEGDAVIPTEPESGPVLIPVEDTPESGPVIVPDEAESGPVLEPVEEAPATGTIVIPGGSSEIEEEGPNVAIEAPADKEAIAEEFDVHYDEPVEVITFKKRTTDPAKVIMISGRQATNLKRSLPTQEALMSAKGFAGVAKVPGATNEDGLTAKQAQLEQMMQQANKLYSEGKVEEAQTMYDQISILNKEIQGESEGIAK